MKAQNLKLIIYPVLRQTISFTALLKSGLILYTVLFVLFLTYFINNMLMLEPRLIIVHFIRTKIKKNI